MRGRESSNPGGMRVLEAVKRLVVVSDDAERCAVADEIDNRLDDRAGNRRPQGKPSIRQRIVPSSEISLDRRSQRYANGHPLEFASAEPSRCRGKAPIGSPDKDAYRSASLLSSSLGRGNSWVADDLIGSRSKSAIASLNAGNWGAKKLHQCSA